MIKIHLALCLKPLFKKEMLDISFLLDLPHVCKETKAGGLRGQKEPGCH